MAAVLDFGERSEVVVSNPEAQSYVRFDFKLILDEAKVLGLSDSGCRHGGQDSGGIQLVSGEIVGIGIGQLRCRRVAEVRLHAAQAESGFEAVTALDEGQRIGKRVSRPVLNLVQVI